MFFHWIRIVLVNKYAEFFILTEKEITQEGILNPLGWSETRKTKIHPTHILPEPEIHSTRVLPEPEHIRLVFNPPARTDRPIGNQQKYP